jgi:hypothetical protein
MADVPFPLGSRTIPMSQLPASNSNSSQVLNCRNRLSLTHQPTRSTPLTELVKVILRLTVSRPVFLGIKHPSGAQDTFLLLSDSCRFIDVGRLLWREDGSVVYSWCWPSPVQLYFPPINSSSHFASWVLIHFFFCDGHYSVFVLSRLHLALSWSAEISLRLLWTCCSETNCLR